MQKYPVFINEKYLLYPTGEVYSLINNIFLKQSMSAGYYIYGSARGLSSVHRLLAEHYLGGIPEGYVVNHKNGIKTDNRLENLEIVTHSENVNHAYENGLITVREGEDNSMAKLTNEQAVELALGLMDGKSNEVLGREFNLHPRYISLVRHGHRWKNLYVLYGPFPRSAAVDPFEERYKIFLNVKETMTNKDIAFLLDVDPSTISRWRNNITKHGKIVESSATTIETTSY